MGQSLTVLTYRLAPWMARRILTLSRTLGRIDAPTLGHCELTRLNDKTRLIVRLPLVALITPMTLTGGMSGVENAEATAICGRAACPATSNDGRRTVLTVRVRESVDLLPILGLILHDFTEWNDAEDTGAFRTANEYDATEGDRLNVVTG